MVRKADWLQRVGKPHILPRFLMTVVKQNPVPECLIEKLTGDRILNGLLCFCRHHHFDTINCIQFRKRQFAHFNRLSICPIHSPLQQFPVIVSGFSLRFNFQMDA